VLVEGVAKGKKGAARDPRQPEVPFGAHVTAVAPAIAPRVRNSDPIIHNHLPAVVMSSWSFSVSGRAVEDGVLSQGPCVLWRIGSECGHRAPIARRHRGHVAHEQDSGLSRITSRRLLALGQRPRPAPRCHARPIGADDQRLDASRHADVAVLVDRDRAELGRRAGESRTTPEIVPPSLTVIAS